MTAPTSLWDLSTTPASNTSVQGNSVAEGCAPSGINDAIRALAAMNKGALIAVSSAGTDTYTATLAPIPDALTTGMGVYIKFGNANLLSSSTLSVNGLTQKTIKKNGATAILPGDIPAGHNGSLYYDGTNWILQNPARAGIIVQVVNTETGAGATGTTVIPQDNTIPQNTEGDQYMSLAITPTNASSTLLIDVVWYGAQSIINCIAVALFQDSTASALAAGMSGAASGTQTCIAFRHKMTAGTTSATTFKVRAGTGSAGTTTFNGSGGAQLYGAVVASSITITEILP